MPFRRTRGGKKRHSRNFVHGWNEFLEELYDGRWLSEDPIGIRKKTLQTSCIQFRQKMFNLPATSDAVELLFLDSSGMDVYEGLNKKTVRNGG